MGIPARRKRLINETWQRRVLTCLAALDVMQQCGARDEVQMRVSKLAIPASPELHHAFWPKQMQRHRDDVRSRVATFSGLYFITDLDARAPAQPQFALRLG